MVLDNVTVCRPMHFPRGPRLELGNEYTGERGSKGGVMSPSCAMMFLELIHTLVQSL